MRELDFDLLHIAEACACSVTVASSKVKPPSAGLEVNLCFPNPRSIGSLQSLKKYLQRNFTCASLRYFDLAQNHNLKPITIVHAELCSKNAATVVLKFLRLLLTILFPGYQRGWHKPERNSCKNIKKIAQPSFRFPFSLKREHSAYRSVLF